MKTSFNTRLKNAMQKENLKQVDIIEKARSIYNETGVKLTKTDLSQYVNGKTAPGQKKLYVLAKILNVSEAWLLGYEVSEVRPTDKERETENKIETLAAHLEGELTEKEWQDVLDYVDFIKSKREK